ncbi:MAG: hypothetical protein H6822_25980 [Planctomycetaceae bacterium]|nr:hypothetical protein [Planctomycetaceae bacterium]
MAKTRPKQPEAAFKRTQEAIDKLKTHYELGQRAVKLSKSTAGTYARGVITQLVEETGENQATINKCRQFAEMYTPAEFKELCQLRRPDGKPIGWGHVTKLLTVPVADKSLRKKLQVQAAKEGWTARRLNDEIQGKYESKLSGMGRKWKLPTSKQQALSQISQRSQQWLRWYEGLENAKGVSVADLPDDVRTRLKAVMRGIRRLEEATS